MKRNKITMIIAVLLLVSCAPQVQTSIPELNSSNVTPIVITSASTAHFTDAKTPLVFSTNTSIIATPHLQSTSTPIVLLPTGQYLVSAEGDNCEPGSSDSNCNLRIMSIDGSLDKMIAENLLGSGFTYNNNRVAFTNTQFTAFRQDFKIKILDLASGAIFDVPAPIGKGCEAEDWSHDGTHLIVLCHSYSDIRNFDITLMSIQDGDLTTLLHDPSVEDASGGYEQPRLSRDGKWLAFYRLYNRDPKFIEGQYILDMTRASEPMTCQNETHKLPVNYHRHRRWL